MVCASNTHTQQKRHISHILAEENMFQVDVQTDHPVKELPVNQA